MAAPTRRRNPYEEPIFYSLGWGFLFFLWSSVALDMGESGAICEGTLITYGVLLVLVVVQRPRHPTPGDLLVLKWAFPALYFVDVLVYRYAWHLRGLR